MTGGMSVREVGAGRLIVNCVCGCAYPNDQLKVPVVDHWMSDKEESEGGREMMDGREGGEMREGGGCRVVESSARREREDPS